MVHQVSHALPPMCLLHPHRAASSSRPATPSYAIATREARERAVTQAAPDTLQASQPQRQLPLLCCSQLSGDQGQVPQLR